jgi:hypothetical protein
MGAYEDQLRSQAEFINALRQVLGLDPLMPQAEAPGPVHHQGWPAKKTGNRQVRRTPSDGS